MKVALQLARETWRPEESRVVRLKSSKPFFVSQNAGMVHRIRQANVHYWQGEWTHTSFLMWCGQQMFIDRSPKKKNNRVTSEPPRTTPVCATCEGRATGAGQLGSHLIAGRMVLFNPR